MKKIFLAVVVSAVLLGGCGSAAVKTTDEQKVVQNVVTKSGMLQAKTETEYLLSTKEGIVNITSTKVNLDSYMKKNITVTGMFSGDVLYVDKLTQ